MTLLTFYETETCELLLYVCFFSIGLCCYVPDILHICGIWNNTMLLFSLYHMFKCISELQPFLQLKQTSSDVLLQDIS